MTRTTPGPVGGVNELADVTRNLQRWSAGEAEALEACLPQIYAELKRIASRSMRREMRAITLQTTDLVHEAWLKLSRQRSAHWHSRAHFFATSSQLMRRLLVDHARGRRRLKRGGGLVHVDFDAALNLGDPEDAAVLAVDEALEDLRMIDSDLCNVITMRFFGGLENSEIAVALGVSPRTVIRRWRTARAWLLAYLNHRPGTCAGFRDAMGPS